VSYTYKAELSYIQLPKVQQHGFVAQELQKVFPEAVTEIQHGDKIFYSCQGAKGVY
jgi:hypothetical protein